MENQAKFFPGSIRDTVSRNTSPDDMLNLGILFESLAKNGSLINPGEALKHADDLLNVAAAVSMSQKNT